jgi:hypothetical protein
MLTLEFWQWLALITAALCAWLVVAFALACFIGRVCALNRWDDDEQC